MGGAISRIIFKHGKDKQLTSAYQSLLDIPVIDIDGNPVPRLGNLLQGKRCILVVNLASK